MKTLYKKTTLLFTATLLAGLLFNSTKAKACTDFHPPAIGVTCDYDATFTEINIRVWGLQLFGSPAGAFCTCAISNWTNIFSNINYVAFVDSGTTNVVTGFAPWTPSSNADAAWFNIQNANWDAFLAQSIGPGLTNGAPVELYIRATLPPGYTFNQLDTSLTASGFGTDEYDNAGNSLALTHNSISYFSQAVNGINYIVQPLSYFANIDNLITGIESKNNSSNTLNVYPNPVKSNVSIEFNLLEQAETEIYITNLLGEKIKTIANKQMNTGLNKFNWKVENIPNGVYLLTVKTENSIQVKKLIVNK